MMKKQSQKQSPEDNLKKSSMGNGAENFNHSDPIRIDMHLHSSFSDGTNTPEELAEKLFESSVSYAALTDHDTLAGLPSFRHAMMKYGIGLVTGIEITTIHKNYRPHLLAYGFDPENMELQDALKGVHGNLELEGGIHGKKFLKTAKAIELTHNCGGLVVLAHPLQTEPDFSKLNLLIDELQKLGLDGIEAIYAQNSTRETEELLQMAKKRNMTISGGTDYHGLDGQAPGISIPIQQWKDFRNDLLKASTRKVWKQTLYKPSLPGKSGVRWFSFTLNIILPAGLALFLFIIALFAWILPYFEKTLMDRKRDNIRELTQVAWGVLEEAAEEVANNQVTLEEGQNLAKNRIEAMRYGSENKDYFWLQDMTPRILMHPYRKDLNGQDVSDFTDPRGVRIFVAFSDLVKEKGEGYINYVWHWKDDLERLEAKESYIQLFEPWGWIIGTGIYVHDVQLEIDNLRNQLLKVSLGIVALVLFILLYLVRNGLKLEKSRNKVENLLQESMERYRTLTESAREGALFVTNGRCRFANNVVYEILGCDPSYLELLDLDDLFPDVEANYLWRKWIFNPKAIEITRTLTGLVQRIDGNRLSCGLTLQHEINSAFVGFMILIRPQSDTEENTQTDVLMNQMLQLPQNIALNLTEGIHHANHRKEVVTLCHATPELVKSLLENGASSIGICRMLSSITDAATQRFINLGIDEIGPPPVPFAFIAMGSEGRESQTLYSDQDNAIIFQWDEEKNGEEVLNYFQKLASKVCEDLEQAGYRKCEANNMASNSKWCQPLTIWKGYFKDWIEKPQPEQVLSFSIFFDFRFLYGELSLVHELRKFIYETIQKTPDFLPQVAKNTLKFKTPIRLFGTLVTSGGKQHPGRLDLKTPTMSIVSFARLYALQQNLIETNTIARLEAITRVGMLLDSKRRDIVTAYESLLRFRLWNQILAIKQNRQPDNWIDPGQLGHIEEVILLECFREIDELQNRIGRDFLGG